MRLRRIKVACFLSLLVAANACKKDKPEDKIQPTPVITNSTGVFVVNEGTFNFGTAKISYYNIATDVVTEDLFKPANNRPLGDVAQSMCFFNNKAYVVVNNSGKIEVVDPKTFVASSTISGFKSPRYFLPVNDNKAYVTDLFSNSIAVVDLTTNTIKKNILCIGWTEQLVRVSDKAFVTNYNSDKVYVVNTTTDVIDDSIAVTYSCASITKDKNGFLWVLSSGNEKKNVFPELFKINPANNKVELSIQFSTLTDSPNRLCMNGSLDVLYYLAKNGVYKLPIGDTQLPTTPVIKKGNYNLYGLGIDPKNETIYLADAIDYVQIGKIYRYKPDGSFINSFAAGIIPSSFYFN
ncbi:MAG: DUF5074 domain-containing protein [Bacteroidia bacterium]